MFDTGPSLFLIEIFYAFYSMEICFSKLWPIFIENETSTFFSVGKSNRRPPKLNGKSNILTVSPTDDAV